MKLGDMNPYAPGRGDVPAGFPNDPQVTDEPDDPRLICRSCDAGLGRDGICTLCEQEREVA